MINENGQATSGIKLCKDCKHFHKEKQVGIATYHNLCHRPSDTPNYLNGGYLTLVEVDYYEATPQKQRMNAFACGPLARYFEEKAQEKLLGVL